MEKCGTCKYFKKQSQMINFCSGETLTEVETSFCRRYPPPKQDRTWEDNWCGEYKENKMLDK